MLINLSLFLLNIITGLQITGISCNLLSSEHKPFEISVQQIQEVDYTNDFTEVRIGLMLPESPENNILAQSAQQGAELAVKMANEKGGFKGTPFKLMIRTAEGLWGAGSKESVKMVYEDEVWAIVSALDGRNSHLTEQVAAKSHIVQIETRASEESLSQAFVPWFFRVVPNDKQQSNALINKISSGEHKNLIIIHEKTFDHEKSAESFKKQAEAQHLTILGTISIDPDQSGFGISKISGNTEVVVYFGGFNSDILERIKSLNPQVMIFGPLSVTADGSIGEDFSDGSEGGVFVSSRFCFTTTGQEFKKEFKSAYNIIPNPAASYTYDGVNLIIETIKKVGLNREKIRDSLAEIRFMSGATGTIQFDEHGNRKSEVFMIRMIKGHPVLLN